MAIRYWHLLIGIVCWALIPNSEVHGAGSSGGGRVAVKGHMRDGYYVQPYTRSAPGYGSSSGYPYGYPEFPSIDETPQPPANTWQFKLATPKLYPAEPSRPNDATRRIQIVPSAGETIILADARTAFDLYVDKNMPADAKAQLVKLGRIKQLSTKSGAELYQTVDGYSYFWIDSDGGKEKLWVSPNRPEFFERADSVSSLSGQLLQLPKSLELPTKSKFVKIVLKYGKPVILAKDESYYNLYRRTECPEYEKDHLISMGRILLVPKEITVEFVKTDDEISYVRFLGKTESEKLWMIRTEYLTDIDGK